MIPHNSSEAPDVWQAILQTVLYADVFDYPLTASEIHRYLPGLSISPEQVEEALRQPQVIQRSGIYFTLPGRSEIVKLRQKRQKISGRLWKYAKRYGQQISHIPFIRMVAVTGSLAMNNSDGSADIDYLVVTTPGRLWLCRAMVLALGRLAASEGINICPNYLITTRSLHFTDQSLYAAHEIAQMVPISGMEIYNNIRAQNEWVMQYLPNANGVPPVENAIQLGESKAPIRSLIETTLQNPFADWLERWEMNRKIQKLGREQSDSPESAFSEDYCKGHSNQYARRTKDAFGERLSIFAGKDAPGC